MKIELTNEEALILFHWLNNNARKDEVFQDKSEQIVMWDISIVWHHNFDRFQLICQNYLFFDR